MQENEKYGIELEAKTSLFKKGLKEAIEYTKAFGKGVKESFGEEVNKTANSWRSAFKDAFSNREKEIEDIRNRKNAIMEQVQNYRGEGNLTELAKEYNELDARLVKLKNAQQEYNEELEETNKTEQKTKSILSTLFDDSIGKIKRFTYYLLGARSVFSLFMKYRSIYYQYNEQMQYQSELSQNAIALSLAPAFEFLGNVLTYASIGLAKFIELLTGVNVLSKVTTKGIRDYNKSLKETQTLVSGIDEITNLTNPQNLGLASQYQALADFQEKIKEVEKFFSENKWITDLAEGLKIVWKWLKENIWPVLVNNIFPAVKELFDFVGKILNLIGLIFEKLGLFEYVVKPIWAFVKALFHTAQFFVEALADILTLDFEKLGRDWQKFKRNIEKDFDITPKIKLVMDGKNYNEIYDKLKNLSIIGGTPIEIQFENLSELEKFEKEINTTKEDVDEVNDALDFTYTIGEDGRIYLTFEKKLKDSKNSADNTKNSLNFSSTIRNDETAMSNLKKKIDEATKSAKEFAKAYTAGGGGFAIGGGGKNSYGGGGSFGGRGYAKGLDYVPYDNYPALLHKGEAVVPAKYNPSIHTESNDYTNSLLETLVYKVEDLASRPNVFEIDGQRFAQATYNLYDNERKRQGYIEGVVR